MKIALAQINPTVGDIEGNAGIIRRHMARAREQGARVVVFPELALLGYPPRDLLLKGGLVEANLAALESLACQAEGIAALVGYVDRNLAPVGRPLYNALALLDGGRVVQRKFKTLLPTYDVFDEARYFEPGPAAVVVEVDGLRLGLSICEDIWNTDDPDLRNLYCRDPIRELARASCDVIVNISASPFVLGKHQDRLRLLRTQATTHKLPVLYCNQVGGNDELIFDGASLALASDGRLLAQCKDFEEDMAVLDLPAKGRAAGPTAAELYEPAGGAASLHDALVLGLGDYFRKCGFSEAVLGLSGGIDSAVVVCLAAAALGPGHVTAVAMPSRYSSPESLVDARLLAGNLGLHLETISIDRIHTAFEQTLAEVFSGLAPDTTEENVQARIRGAMLMALSNKFGWLLLATGNKSELAAGYCTLYGDMCGGLAPIGDVPKLMVYELARYINRDREIIPASVLTKPPSAELKPDQTDQDTLPPYEVLDRIVQLYVEDQVPLEKLIASGIDAETARRMVRLIDLAEYKRRQAAPVLKVTGRAFGMGRRMPIAQRFRPST
ncbi:MAG: NAD+ synthase [Anaerolineaceae bacterium]|nr:NAD+ synthase [Anaerolineaceae bacterium]